MYGPTAGYWMTRSVYRSTGYAPWRGTMTDYSQQIITNEIITTEDYDHLKELCRDLSGTGTYIEEARKYLTEKGYTFADTYRGTFLGQPHHLEYLHGVHLDGLLPGVSDPGLPVRLRRGGPAPAPPGYRLRGV